MDGGDHCQNSQTGTFRQPWPIGLAALQMAVADAAIRLMAWLPIPLQELEPCIPSRKARRQQTRAWFSNVELPPRPRSAADHMPLPVVA